MGPPTGRRIRGLEVVYDKGIYGFSLFLKTQLVSRIYLDGIHLLSQGSKRLSSSGHSFVSMDDFGRDKYFSTMDSSTNQLNNREKSQTYPDPVLAAILTVIAFQTIQINLDFVQNCN